MRHTLALFFAVATLAACGPDDGPCRRDGDCNGAGLVCDVPTGFCINRNPFDHAGGGRRDDAVGGGSAPSSGGGTAGSAGGGYAGGPDGRPGGGGVVGAGGGGGTVSGGNVSPGPRNAQGMPLIAGRPGMAVDATGTTHLMMVLEASSPTLSYGRCASNCLAVASWTWVAIRPSPSGDVSLAIDDVGTLHAAVAHEWSSGVEAVEYFSCSAACTVPASWRGGLLRQDVDLSVGQGTFLAVRSGVVRVAYGAGSNAVIGQCAASCASSSSWTFTVVPLAGVGGNQVATDVDVDVAQDGTARAAFLYQQGGTAFLLQCAGSCAAPAQWSVLVSSSVNGRAISVASSSGGGVRLTYRTGPYSDLKLAHMVCPANCAVPQSWTGWLLPLETSGAEDALDSQFDSSGRIVIVHSGLGDTQLRRCVSDCNAGGQWTASVIDSDEAVKSQLAGPRPACGPGEEANVGWDTSEQGAVVRITGGQLRVVSSAMAIWGCAQRTGTFVAGLQHTRYVEWRL